jgi:hypothetical protein
MARKATRKGSPAQRAISLARAGRLFRLIALLAAPGRSRPVLLKRLKVDLRGFYRDLEKLREFGVEVSNDGQHYRLETSFAKAVARLPFPDPRLNLNEAMLLAKGRTPAHRKLRYQIERITGKTGMR